MLETIFVVTYIDDFDVEQLCYSKDDEYYYSMEGKFRFINGNGTVYFKHELESNEDLNYDGIIQEKIKINNWDSINYNEFLSFALEHRLVSHNMERLLDLIAEIPDESTIELLYPEK